MKVATEFGTQVLKLPLVSCIMPTYNRRQFVPLAIAYFLRQDYPNKELVVVDDGTEPVGDLMPSGDPRVRYVRLEARTPVGAKRNLACDLARGDIIAHWDDDDWHAPHRLRYQVEGLLESRADVCGIQTLLFYDPPRAEAWRYRYTNAVHPWVGGSTLCYTRAFWQRNPFPDVDVGEDARFVANASPDHVLVLPDYSFHVGLIHQHNISTKYTDGPYWEAYPLHAIETVLGPDWAAYQPAVSLPVPRSAPGDSTFVVARSVDLELPEFAAFNYGQRLAWMRRWELPFALFQARLPTTGTILDCTINPANLAERLVHLYPYVQYVHRSPIQDGRFVLPVDVPDAAFDRVLCINTLEHVLRPQREALLTMLGRKLKPDGLLILTSDAYFESSWQQPEFLNAGVMRVDRHEVFNGWNKTSPLEWIDSCAREGLAPLDPPPPEPVETEPGLFLNPAPFAHACIGGVFARSGTSQRLPSGKRIVLSLLVWNTREVSLESASAYLHEARMLRRIGHEPSLCICDNGSDDGTSEALRAFAAQADVPIHLILNDENRGNAVGRNQIINYALEWQADYLLMMDGDIEIVPFSSFAMLRHMENSGRELGAIGANSVEFTSDRATATPYLYAIDPGALDTSDVIAYTQYGLFRREVFADGARFEERGPFSGAGWGFEDNDLAFEMNVRGYMNQSFRGMRYLHRDLRSSVRIMRARGIDAASLCEARKQFVVNKWSGTVVDTGALDVIRRTYIAL